MLMAPSFPTGPPCGAAEEEENLVPTTGYRAKGGTGETLTSAVNMAAAALPLLRTQTTAAFTAFHTCHINTSARVPIAGVT